MTVTNWYGGLLEVNLLLLVIRASQFVENPNEHTLVCDEMVWEVQ
jgi:hypothetical protein